MADNVPPRSPSSPSPPSAPPRSAGDPGRALAGIRALVLDADGVLVLRGEPIPGAPEAIHRLAARGIPYRIVTNYSTAHRSTLAGRFTAVGAPISAEQIVTAASASAAYTARAHAGQPIFVIAAPDALREFEGQELLAPEDAVRRGATAGAVVIGDAGDDLPFAHLDAAFRLIRGGAAFLAMHRNPWWLTSRGETLDSGALVAGLEFALGERATVLGKPSPALMRTALAALAAELGGGPLPAKAVAMVGDDLAADLAPARRIGMRSVLVLSGKVDADGLEAAVERARFRPDAVLPSIVEVVGAVA
jgi:HAD superfamily hydrolase (TIGR01450 family)